MPSDQQWPWAGGSWTHAGGVRHTLPDSADLLLAGKLTSGGPTSAAPGFTSPLPICTFREKHTQAPDAMQCYWVGFVCQICYAIPKLNEEERRLCIPEQTENQR